MSEYECLVQSSCGGDVCEHGASLDQVSLFQNISVKSFFKIVQTIIIMRMKNTPADYASMTIRISNSEVGIITLVFRRYNCKLVIHIELDQQFLHLGHFNREIWLPSYDGYLTRRAKT